MRQVLEVPEDLYFRVIALANEAQARARLIHSQYMVDRLEEERRAAQVGSRTPVKLSPRLPPFHSYVTRQGVFCYVLRVGVENATVDDTIVELVSRGVRPGYPSSFHPDAAEVRKVLAAHPLNSAPQSAKKAK